MSKNIRKARRAINLEVKLDILKRLDRGEKNVEICRTLGLSKSTIATIKENRVNIESSLQKVTPLSAKNISKARNSVVEDLERLLNVWIDHQTQRNIPISTNIIQEKARSLHANLLSKGTYGACGIFTASKGWFERFKKRYSLHNIKTTGEAASADIDAARKYPEEFNKIIESRGYTPQQACV